MKKAFTLLSLALLFSLTLVSAYSNWDDRYNWNREYYTISTRDYHQYNSPRYIDYDRPYYVYQQKGFYTDSYPTSVRRIYTDDDYIFGSSHIRSRPVYHRTLYVNSYGYNYNDYGEDWHMRMYNKRY
ncbi:MAG TPA: hypothetical protein VJK51_02860 [Candidatus Nanoarchaeia archaeon]|nr:hypothetical protein [Candidatus Nanoarchaeia archaeon]